MFEDLYMSESVARAKMNSLAGAGVPFLFVIDFDKQHSIVQSLDKLENELIHYDFPNASNSLPLTQKKSKIEFEKFPVHFDEFSRAHEQVMAEILFGNSFLLNLTFETPIKTNLSLKEIFDLSKSKYRIYLKDFFVSFSPETFVKIKGNKIFSYPMKGTIDANLKDAEMVILSDEKEMAEHYTIVDLIRNDLSMVSKKVRVNKFRFIDRLTTNYGDILQVSSEIEGTLPDDFYKILGDIIFKLLPAGSISGAPKEKTLEIIGAAESHKRGFYTGICGIFDGKNLDSAVLIRFIEKKGSELYFKSGGGITFQSDPLSEYNEMIKKVYVPFT